MSENIYEKISKNPLTMDVWKDKYKHTGENKPEDTVNRLIKAFSDKISHNSIGLAVDILDLSDYGTEVWSMIKTGHAAELVASTIGFDKCIPGGSGIYGIGNIKANSSISNCFTIESPHDSLEGITYSEMEMKILEKARGGVGLNLSTIRPKGAKVNNQSKSSTGVETFVVDFSQNNNIVAQDGRRGALMLILDVNHPDILDFVKIKSDLSKVTGANLSVLIDDNFMNNVAQDNIHIMKFPLNSDFVPTDEQISSSKSNTLQYDESSQTYWKWMKSSELWHEITYYAWKVAEPGILMKDNWYKFGTDGVYENYRPVATNPCSEIAMQAYDSCRLMSYNLMDCVVNPYEDNAYVDYEHLYKMCYNQMLMTDTMIDIEIDHINNIISKNKNDRNTPEHLQKPIISLYEKILKNTRDGRRCGCGFIGYADMIASLGITFEDIRLDEKKRNIVEKVFMTKRNAELACSVDLAVLFGCFKGFDPDKDLKQEFFHDLDTFEQSTIDRMKVYGRRNVSWSTAAPTGTISMMANVSSGIEPVFFMYYSRKIKIDGTSNDSYDEVDVDGNKFRHYNCIHPGIIEWFAHRYCNGSYIDANEKMSKMSVEEIESFVKISPYHNQAANDIKIDDRIFSQKLVQKYTTHSISSTLNLPNDCTREEIAEIYVKSWKSGLKGNTVYRDGCRSGVIVSQSDTHNKNEKRPASIPAILHKIKYKNRFYAIIIGFVDGHPYEIFILNRVNNILKNNPLDKFKGCIIRNDSNNYDFYEDDIDGDTQYEVDQNSEPMVIMDLDDMEDKEQKFQSLTISRLMRLGDSMDKICALIDKSEPISCTFTSRLLKILSIYKETQDLETCPNCGAKLVHENGCVSCKNCGYGKC